MRLTLEFLRDDFIMNKEKDVHILVLNYNGRKIIEECMPSIVQATKKSRFSVNISVIDNVSTDDSVEYLKREFPDVNLFIMEENKFLLSYNDVLKKINEEIVILLNNDISVDEGFIDQLVEPFLYEETLFFTAPRTLKQDGTGYEGNLTRIEFKYGFFRPDSYFDGYLEATKNNGPTIMTGFGAFRRKWFLALGGYDSLYLPGRWEDLDICYRGWKHGWRGIYVANSIVYHKGAYSFNNRFGEYRTLVIAQRNHYLFIWKNLTDPALILNHILFLVPRLCFAFVRGNKSFVLGFIKSIPYLLRSLSRRYEMPAYQKKDRDILGLF